MEPAPKAPAPAPAQTSASASASASHRHGALKFVAVGQTKFRSLVAWARLESSRRRGGASSGRGHALESLSMKLRGDAAGNCGVRGAPGWRSGGNGGGGSVDAGAGGACLVMAKEAVHLVVSLGMFIILDTYLKKFFKDHNIDFPSALFGMFFLFLLLSTFSIINIGVANKLEAFFSPANLFIQRWLPLFYVPSLVVVPLAVKGISAVEGAKIGVILVGGWICTLFVAGFTAMQVRKMVNTELLPVDPVPKAAPFTSTERFSWTAIMLLSFGVAVLYPTALGPVPTTAAPFLLAATSMGYLMGTSLPEYATNVFHPMVACLLSAELGAYALGIATGRGFEAILGDYMTKSARSPGAGDILNKFLGPVILSFAFSIYRQRKIVKRHAAEIITAVVVSSTFSLYSTGAAGRLLGLLPSLRTAIIPHCVTVALALPIASLLDGTNPSITAASVVTTGLTGANFAEVVMNKFGFKDPITRGMATASSSHGLGTAALARNEPEALPYCAIAYALTGIVSTILCTLPPVRTSLLIIAGVGN